MNENKICENDSCLIIGKKEQPKKLDKKELIEKFINDNTTVLTRKIEMGNNILCPYCEKKYPLGTHYCIDCKKEFGKWKISFY